MNSRVQTESLTREGDASSSEERGKTGREDEVN